jgi:FkbM family methyltransferase
MIARLPPLAFRPYIFHELPAWGRLYRWLGADGSENTNATWRSAPLRIARGKKHGYLMELDLSDDLDRGVYFLGRYYDLDLQLLLDELLRPGDTFINVGANAGYVVLHAASRVGPQGRVVAFEPQPGCCGKLCRNLELNGIEHVKVHACALGEREDKLELKMLGGTSIMSTLCIDETDVRVLRDRIEVPVRVGDDLLSGRVVGDPTLMVDVEGFELYVLRGLDRTIEQYRPPILIEVVPRYLLRAGTNVDEQFAYFHDRGYNGYVIWLRARKLLPLRGGWLRSAFKLRPVSTPEDLRGAMDLLWLPKEGGRFDPAPHILEPEKRSGAMVGGSHF